MIMVFNLFFIYRRIKKCRSKAKHVKEEPPY